jgi:hypothetical protein
MKKTNDNYFNIEKGRGTMKKKQIKTIFIIVSCMVLIGSGIIIAKSISTDRTIPPMTNLKLQPNMINQISRMEVYYKIWQTNSGGETTEEMLYKNYSYLVPFPLNKF